MTKTASDVLIDTVHAWGVNVVFGLPGDGINGIMEALRKRQDRMESLFRCQDRSQRCRVLVFHHVGVSRIRAQKTAEATMWAHRRPALAMDTKVCRDFLWRRPCLSAGFSGRQWQRETRAPA